MASYKVKFVCDDGKVIEEVELTALVADWEVDYYFKGGVIYDILFERKRLEEECGHFVFVRIDSVPKRIEPSKPQPEQRIGWFDSVIRQISTFFNF